MFYKKGILENFVQITGKYLCQRPFLIKFQDCSDRYFPINFAKILRTLFLLKASGSHFFQILPNLKKRRKEHKQFKNESKKGQNTNFELLQLFLISKEEKM